ncbi:MAG TPA: arsenite efflux transporter metallochaperone ArsD [Verrucomicrobiae bacterium]|nr:arsenite efflux transporter metallochaperone ArsD [Verrucomicrobiae bacterium]
MKNSSSHSPEDVRQAVRAGYGRIATAGGSCCGGSSSSCGSAPVSSEHLARLVGYSAEELAALPGGANMGLSCGNPNALASLQPGEVVLDLGSGGGFDIFIAGKKVGAEGRAIGVDMTPEMLAKARNNVGDYLKQTGLDNVEFRLGEIEHLPLADSSVDVVISNCVLNLSPDKPQVWREIARVLKPGGRVAVSDLALLKPLPQRVVEMVEALVGCVAGAVLVSETERMAQDAGLRAILLNPKSDYIDAMVDWQDPLYQKIIATLPTGTTPGEYITSLEVTARKPGTLKSESHPKSFQVFDPPMCCSTGVCGPNVDPVLVRFAADLSWLQEQGVNVERHNLSQSPAAFVENDLVKQALTDRGEAALPIILSEGKVQASGRYPERAELEAWADLGQLANSSAFSAAVAELVAIGAATAANCEPCLKYHCNEARKLGVSKSDMARAVETGAKVKDPPHQAILRLADKLTGSVLSGPDPEPDACCGVNTKGPNSTSKCCG